MRGREEKQRRDVQAAVETRLEKKRMTRRKAQECTKRGLAALEPKKSTKKDERRKKAKNKRRTSRIFRNTPPLVSCPELLLFSRGLSTTPHRPSWSPSQWWSCRRGRCSSQGCLQARGKQHSSKSRPAVKSGPEQAVKYEIPVASFLWVFEFLVKLKSWPRRRRSCGVWSCWKTLLETVKTLARWVTTWIWWKAVLSRVRRPRLYWLSVKLRERADVEVKEVNGFDYVTYKSPPEEIVDGKVVKKMKASDSLRSLVASQEQYHHQTLQG